jgi:heterodisulfide reductase subunit C2
VTETTATSLPGAAAVESLSHTHIAQCYQCGKCTAGCPVAEHMDSPPTRLIRLLQLGDLDAALRSDSIWQCVSCQTCATRCPKSVDCASILDALRQLAFERGTVSPQQRRTVVFQKAFLDNIRRHGRLNELELIALFKGEVFLRDRALPVLFEDADLAPKLQRRRKLHLIGERVRDRGVVSRIFARSLNGGAR